MANKKVTATQNDELFVLQTGLISESTKKIIEIRDFSKKIEDPENNHKEIVSPTFKLAGGEFSIIVIPDCIRFNEPGFIGVALFNQSKEEQLASATFKVAPFRETGNCEMKKLQAGQAAGWYNFLPQVRYRKGAKVHGDVLQLEVVMTLHRKADGDGWTR